MLKYLRRKLINDLRFNRGQFFAVWLVVMLGTTFYGAMYPAATNVVNSGYRAYDESDFMDFQVQMEPGSPAVVDEVRALPDVVAAQGRLVVEGGLQLQPEQSYRLNLRLISVPDVGEPAVNRSELTAGRALQEPGEILLLRTFATRHGIRAGDSITVWVADQSYTLHVAGLVFNAEYLVLGRSGASPFPTPSTFGVGWIAYSELAAMAGQPGLINEVVLRLDEPSNVERSALEDETRAALTDLFAGVPGTAIYSRVQTPSGGVIDANVIGSRMVMTFFSGLFLSGAMVVTAILLARLVESERQRIGTLRALGVTRRELVVHYLSFGFVLGLSGALVGSVLGYFCSFWTMSTFINYVAGGHLPGFANTPQIPFLLLGVVIVVIGATFAGAYPAWVQSATPPGIALRPATPKTPSTLSRASLGWLPLVLRKPARNLLRAPGRSLGTVLGLIAGAMMLFSALTLWDSLAKSFDDYYASNDFDLRVDFGVFQPAEALETRLAGVPGVEAAQAALIGPVSVLRADGTTFDTAAVALDERDPFVALYALEGAAPFSGGEGVWIGHNLRRVLEIDAGDTIRVRAFNQEHEVRVLGVVAQAMGSPIYAPGSLLAQWVPGGVLPTNTALVRVAPGQAQAVREAVVGLPGVIAVEVIDTFHADVDHYIDYFRMNTVIMGSFGVILALVLIFNTVNASLRERREELAVQRALGVRGREIALTVTLELLVMVAIGIAIGLPLGRMAGFWLNRSYSTDFFGVLSYVYPLSYILGVAGLLLVALLAELPGLRAVQRADLGQVSKSQSF